MSIDISELEKYSGKDYGPEYFYAIDGEIYGQAAPGVEAVYVNGKPVQVDVDLSFKTKVSLKKGEKYLTIETRYLGLSFVKKYLVIRHPKVEKSFTIHVPKQEFQKIIETKPVAIKTKPPEQKTPPKEKERPKLKLAPSPKPVPKPVSKHVSKPVPKPKPSAKEAWLGFESVRELEPGRFLSIRRVDGKYFGAIYVPEKNVWIPLDQISYLEFKALLEEGKLPPSFEPKNKL